jgi:hypothetical protein
MHQFVPCLLQALEPRHSLLCDYDPPFGGDLYSLPQLLGHFAVGPDPSLLECWADVRCGSASLQREHRQQRAPLPTFGALHCMGTLQQ